MGYTHYINQKPELPLDKFKLFANECMTIAKLSKVPIQLDLDDNNPPQMTQKIVRFNGIGKDGHETFWLERIFLPFQWDKLENGFYFSFCKTNRKPYDIVVVACLYSAKWHFKDSIQLESDGNLQDRIIGHELFTKATGKIPILWDCDN